MTRKRKWGKIPSVWEGVLSIWFTGFIDFSKPSPTRNYDRKEYYKEMCSAKELKKLSDKDLIKSSSYKYYISDWTHRAKSLFPVLECIHYWLIGCLCWAVK